MTCRERLNIQDKISWERTEVQICITYIAVLPVKDFCYEFRGLLLRNRCCPNLVLLLLQEDVIFALIVTNQE